VPSLLLPSPVMLDQSFPRSDEDLRVVAASLGQLEEIVRDGEAKVLLTPILCQIVEEFDWTAGVTQRLLVDVYNLIAAWAFRQSEYSVKLDVEDIEGAAMHPVPVGCPATSLVNLWSEQVGKLLVCHDEDCTDFCIGVVSHLAFAGERCEGYGGSTGVRSFPLVGPSDLHQLADAYIYGLPSGRVGEDVSFDAAKKNVFLLGALRVEKPSSGSHYQVFFAEGRKWPLDRNTDPIPDRFLKQLKEVVDMPLNVIKYVLAHGEVPPLVARIRRLR